MITIDLSFFSDLGDRSIFYIMGVVFIYIGWIPLLFVFGWAAKVMWLKWRQGLYAKTLNFTLLAIDIPKENRQEPKAVEHIFSQLAGAMSSLDFREKWWCGKFQPSFSFEIISLGGYVQFLVRTQTKFRDLVEASFYAQYPEAEIVEVDDYANKIPQVYPDETHDLFGTEFILAKPSAYPIRTYPQFEHSLAKPGETFKDPMAGLLELMSRISAGEQMWLQLIIIPAGSEWQKEGEAEVAKLLGRKPAAKKTFLGVLGELPVKLIEEINIHVLGMEPAEAVREEADRTAKLSKVETDTVAAIQTKLSKTAFLTKFRFVYTAEKSLFNKGRAVFVKGALQQFGSSTVNSFKGFKQMTPRNEYFWQRWLENLIKMSLQRFYLFRDIRGAPLYVLNTEELATLYHFPISIVQAPLLKKTEAKRAEPPFKLPVHRGSSSFIKTPAAGSERRDESGEPAGPELPEELPFV